MLPRPAVAAALLVALQAVAGVAVLAPHVAFFGLTGAAAAWGPELLLLPTSLAAARAVHRVSPLLLAAIPRPGGARWLRVGIAGFLALGGLAAVGLACRALGFGGPVALERVGTGAVGLALGYWPAGYLTAAAGRELWRTWPAQALLAAQAVVVGAAVLTPFSRGMFLPAAGAALVWVGLALLLRYRRWPGAEGYAAARRLHHAVLLRLPAADLSPALLLAAFPVGALVPAAGGAVAIGAVLLFTWAWLRAGAAAGEPARTAASSRAFEQATLSASGDGRSGGAPVRGGSAAPDGASDAGKGRADPGGPARGGEG